MSALQERVEPKEHDAAQRTPRRGKAGFRFLRVLRAPSPAWYRLLFLIILPALSFGPTAQANEAALLAPDPVFEARVMRVADELRCLVCQNETIAGSQAALAIDLRRQIRTQLQQGRSEAEILDFMVQRYGEFVRYRPAFNPTNALLWTGPFVLLAFAAFVLVKNIRRRTEADRDLSDDERRRLGELLGRGATQP
ncbi:MAG: cytochrome c-type biogenesis protein CcmH [Rhizobiales bacterium]|nr:cytochrome c-type biogenesis protein CcmH [Rhizobacter sp.]